MSNPIAVPPMTPVSSSNLESVGHDGSALFIRFKSKPGVPSQTWMYRGVAASYAPEIAKAESPGAMFHRLIKAARHPGEKVG
jgi:hypothetical protein